MNKPVDQSKKSNRRCCNCGNYAGGDYGLATSSLGNAPSMCLLLNIPKNYWNCCKSFSWREDKEYINTAAQYGKGGDGDGK